MVGSSHLDGTLGSLPIGSSRKTRGVLQHKSGAFQQVGGPFWESMKDLFGKLPNGEEVHLASVVVGGGKRRLFLIGNYVKQCL